MPTPTSPPASARLMLDRLSQAITAVAPDGLLSAYLFGSRAEDRAHRESDADVGILLSWTLDRAARFERGIRLASLLPARLGVADVDVVVLNDAPPLLGRHIVLDGTRAFCRDAEADHAYRRDVMLRAADLEPFLRRMRRIKLEALAG